MNALRAFCHNCGADIVRDRPILLNDYSMLGDGHPLFYGKVQVKLTPSQRAVVWTLLKAFPDVVRTSTMLDRIGFDGDDDHVVTVLVSKIRSQIRAAGAVEDPIVTVRTMGYRWNVPGYENAADRL